jgi:predicted  nucleic acid-binding Zn-ribbon protein
LKNSLERIDDLTVEMTNIETAHNDLLSEFQIMKRKNEKLSMQNKTLESEVHEITNQSENLKKQIIK